MSPWAFIIILNSHKNGGVGANRIPPIKAKVAEETSGIINHLRLKQR
jgi:hypothetical protein